MATEKTDTSSPALHYLGALVITLIVTGLAFLVTDPTAKWLVFTVGVIMDLSVIAVALKPAPKREQ